jgi:hypothetical protein
MSAPAAFKGTYSDLRFIKSRKVCQVVVEIPIEDGHAFVGTFGTPNPASETWVALARLQSNVTSIKPKEKQRWDDLKVSAQASIRCTEPAFQRYMAELGYVVENEDDAAGVVRELCNVDSRRQLNLDPAAAEKWRQLEREFKLWMKAPQHA